MVRYQESYMQGHIADVLVQVAGQFWTSFRMKLMFLFTKNALLCGIPFW